MVFHHINTVIGGGYTIYTKCLILIQPTEQCERERESSNAGRKKNLKKIVGMCEGGGAAARYISTAGKTIY